MLGRKRGEAADSLLQLAGAAGLVAPSSLVPGDDDVDETLEEVLFGRVRGAPRILERLVRLEVLAGAR